MLAKAAKILRSLKGALESSSDEAPPQSLPAPAADPVRENAHDQVQDLAPDPDHSDSPDQDEVQPTRPAGPEVLLKPD